MKRDFTPLVFPGPLAGLWRRRARRCQERAHWSRSRRRSRATVRAARKGRRGAAAGAARAPMAQPACASGGDDPAPAPAPAPPGGGSGGRWRATNRSEVAAPKHLFRFRTLPTRLTAAASHHPIPPAAQPTPSATFPPSHCLLPALHGASFPGFRTGSASSLPGRDVFCRAGALAGPAARAVAAAIASGRFLSLQLPNMAAAAGGGRAPRRPPLLTPRGNGDRTVFLFDRRREQADPDEKVLSYGKDNYRGFRSAVCQVRGRAGGVGRGGGSVL